ncbi:MAG: MEKHLA domain-containing protein [Methylovulum sp.]
MLAEVTDKGYIANYQGVRISGTGKRFLIKNAVVWNLRDKDQYYKGQAACLTNGRFYKHGFNSKSAIRQTAYRLLLPFCNITFIRVE